MIIIIYQSLGTFSIYSFSILFFLVGFLEFQILPDILHRFRLLRDYSTILSYSDFNNFNVQNFLNQVNFQFAIIEFEGIKKKGLDTINSIKISYCLMMILEKRK